MPGEIKSTRTLQGPVSAVAGGLACSPGKLVGQNKKRDVKVPKWNYEQSASQG